MPASRIQGAVATEGLIARFGGDEFLVVCTTDDDEARPQRLAAAILAAFGDSFRMAARNSRSPRASASRARPNTATVRSC
jgi:GGDEF domain-containing protein